MKLTIKANQVKTGDQLVRHDGRVQLVIQVRWDQSGEAVKILLADRTTLWAPCMALLAVERPSRMEDHDAAETQPLHVYRSETPEKPSRGWVNKPGGVKVWVGGTLP